jgi:S1-C subfamily serine protease
MASTVGQHKTRTMKTIITFIFLFAIKIVIAQDELINNSRDNCVFIYSVQGNSTGTGFFIDKYHIVTCFHVVAKTENGIINYFNDLIVLTNYGERINASVFSKVASEDSTPIKNDFAIVSLLSKPKNYKTIELEVDKTIKVGSKILFSGFPFGKPNMLTHTGNISGIFNDSSVISIQSSINKGNSGGALINERGKIIGIITLREGGISFELEKLLQEIKESEKNYRMMLAGINQLKVQRETIEVLNNNISTGIGYAYSIKFALDWYNKYLK